MKYLSKRILEAINSGVRIGLSLDNFDNTDNKLPTIKKDIKSKAHNVANVYEKMLRQQCETLQFDEGTLNMLKLCKDFKWTPKNNDDFVKLVSEFIIQTNDYKANLNWINTSKITNMSELFAKSFRHDKIDLHKFNGDISKWDVHNVTNMSRMFYHSDFEGDISNWDVSSAENMENMFAYSKFNGDISKWNVSNVENMCCMFSKCENLIGDISKWDVHNVTNMCGMFQYGKFLNNADISNWNVSNVKNMSSMFAHSKFNGDISNWNVSSVTNMESMFYHANFNKDISNWDVSNVINMKQMFAYSPFNKDISNWNVQKNVSVHQMFSDSLFKGDISNWNISDKQKKLAYEQII